MYKTIEELVDKIDERNTDGSISELIGVSIDKCFIKSVANTNGTDLSKYKILNTKIKILQRLLSQAIDEFRKVNKIMGMEFADRLKRVIDEYNNRRRDEAYANEVLDDVAEQLAQLLEELK